MRVQFFSIVIICLFLLPGLGHTQNLSKVIEAELSIQEKFLTDEYNLRKRDIDLIREAKAHLINGDLAKSISALDKIHESDSRVGSVKKRYLSIIHFIQGDYQKTIEMLSGKEFNNNATFSEICTTKIFSHLVLEQYNKAKELNARCQAITNQYSRNSQLWLINIFDLAIDKRFKLGNNNGVSNGFLTEGNEIAQLWLKMALFSNREQFIDHYIGSLPSEAYNAKRIREIIGYAYYRLNNKDKALSFIEDIDTANAENLKGNLSLEKKEYELAYGHFKLALKNKENSLSALERAIPLTWKLGLHQEGKELLQRHLSGDFYGKRALDIAFDIRLENYELAKKKLLLLNRRFVESKPLKVSLMNSFLATYLNDASNKELFAEEACKRFDGVNCWLRLQHSLWPNFAAILKNEEKVIELNEFSFETLKQKQTIKELDEPINVNQRDIEELDGKQVQMPIPQAS